LGKQHAEELEFHPLNFTKLLKEQEMIMKILAMEDTKYELQDFHGGGKTTSLICFRNKIVVPAQLHVTQESTGLRKQLDNIYGGPKMRDHITNSVKICPACQRNKRRQKKYGG